MHIMNLEGNIQITSSAVEYRVESYGGSGVRDLIEILEFEICELGNSHIISDMLDKDLISLEVANRVLKLSKGVGEILMEELCLNKGKQYRYGLWLTDEESVKKIYKAKCGEAEGYLVSDCMLCDLEKDGRLYAYEKLPRPCCFV